MRAVHRLMNSPLCICSTLPKVRFHSGRRFPHMHLRNLVDFVLQKKSCGLRKKDTSSAIHTASLNRAFFN